MTLKLNSVKNNETIGQERIFTHFEDSHWYSQKRQHRWVFLWLWNVIQQCDDYVLLCKQLISLTKTALSVLSKCTNKSKYNAHYTRDIKQLVNTRNAFETHSIELQVQNKLFSIPHFTAMILSAWELCSDWIWVHIYLNNGVMFHCAENLMCINNTIQYNHLKILPQSWCEHSLNIKEMWIKILI